MSPSPDLVTVYRSMDATAKEDCQILLDMLAEQGISAVLLDDSAPGVPAGAFEVRVPAKDADRADQAIAEHPLEEDEVEEVDASANLDLETIFRAHGTLAEVESLAIKSVLEANGIAALLVGTTVLPVVSFEVRVARDQAEPARQLIREAQSAGPLAAEEAELESEAQAGEDGNPA